MQHQITRVRHEIRRRKLIVREVTNITPSMRRVTLAGPELEGFLSAAPDDHIKLFIPDATGETAMRDYTPRRHDAANGTLVLDFAVHDAGPATQWALDARPGTQLEIAGPRGSLVVSDSFDWWLLIGDETALPAIGRRLEELSPTTRVIGLAAVTGPEEQQVFAAREKFDFHWIHRPAEKADDATALIATLRSIDLPPGDGFVWIAGEARVARALRAEILSRGHRADWMRAAGYWLKGQADAHEKIED